MQLAPIASAPAHAAAGTPFDGVGINIGTGHWMAPHGLPKYTAGWWTAGADLTPAGGWASREAAVEGARLLSAKVGAPLAVTMGFGHDDVDTSGNGPRYLVHRIATSELVEGDAGWASRPDMWLTSDMLHAPQFRGYTMSSFALVAILDKGEFVNVNTDPRG